MTISPGATRAAETPLLKIRNRKIRATKILNQNRLARMIPKSGFDQGIDR
jgi:hypothetical protein